MDSPRLELSNGILFAIFRYRLTHFPFLIHFLLKIGSSREEAAAAGKGMSSCRVGPSGSERNKGEMWCTSGGLGTRNPAPQVMVNERHQPCTTFIQIILSFKISPQRHLGAFNI
jgi:hypothetical protein